MFSSPHLFHIPVMGTGHSIDTPIRVAPFGISSVISLVDDLLLEKIRNHYCGLYDLPYEKIARKAEDGRAKRITAYLDMVHDVVTKKFEAIREQTFAEDSEKSKYFRMLPDVSELKQRYLKMLKMDDGPVRAAEEEELTERMVPGSIDVNIMVKLDRINYEGSTPMSDEFSDAKAALRGYAQSKLDSAIVFSAGINQSLFGYMAEFMDFFRDAKGYIKKRIVLKVSDFRSAMIQGRFLARKGLEVHEFRIESGLNCGGHAFPSEGELLPTLLQEFFEKRSELKKQFLPSVEKVFGSKGWVYPEGAKEEEPLLTVQGGIGIQGEAQRLHDDYGVDRTGWASPFLLVPEATCIDRPTLELLVGAKEEDCYLSGASPLGIPFNNIRNSGSDLWTRQQAEKGKPGSPCPKGFLVSNVEFSELPICTASKEYQGQKLDEIDGSDLSSDAKTALKTKVLEKACICDHLGNGALIALGMARENLAPQSICPGPNVAWFDRTYSLEEMVDHIYGRSVSLTPEERPHMYCKEIEMYLEWYTQLVQSFDGSDKQKKRLETIRGNFLKGIDYCETVAGEEGRPGENMESLRSMVRESRTRLEGLFSSVC